jgi:hypothetical protein
MPGIPYSLNDRVVEEGEVAFLGLASRMNPVSLPPGLVQMSQNMRFDRGTAQTRLGAARVGDDIPEPTPLSLPFPLASDVSISSITRVGTTATATATAHGFVTTDYINVRGADQEEYNGDFIVTVVDADTFTYTMDADPGADATGTLLANPGPVVLNDYAAGIFAGAGFSDPTTGRDRIALFGVAQAYVFQSDTLIATVAYPGNETILPAYELCIEQAFGDLFLFRYNPEFVPFAASSITRTSTTATVTAVGHGLASGQRVRITGPDQIEYAIEHDITVVDADTFTFPVPNTVATPATGGPIRVVRVLPPLRWNGAAAAFVATAAGVHPTGASFRNLPAAPFAVYWQNQLVAPYGRDEILISDILDLDTYDPLLKSFRSNAGSADYIVAIHPWIESSFLVFMRRSIYVARIVLDDDGTALDPALSRLDLLTDEVGCVARQSVVTAGTSVFFLSDAGLYRLDTQLDLKLRGNTRPLSDPVDDIFRRIDPARAAKSQGVYWRNRYYLLTSLVPEDGGEADEALIIFNTLTDNWESVDSFTVDLGWLFVGLWQGDYRLLAASRTGRLMLLEELEGGDAEPSGDALSPIAATFRTRRYVHGNMADKRLLRTRISAHLPPGAAFRVSSNLRDADQFSSLGVITNTRSTHNDISVRLPIRRLGHFAEIEIDTLAGRPEIRQLLVDASIRLANLATRTTE